MIWQESMISSAQKNVEFLLSLFFLFMYNYCMIEIILKLYLKTFFLINVSFQNYFILLTKNRLGKKFKKNIREKENK